MRFDFGEKLDLTYFRKYVLYNLKKFPEKEHEYELFTKLFKISFSTNPKDSFFVRIIIKDIERDADGEIIKYKNIFPCSDYRFSSFKEFKVIFDNPYSCEATPSLKGEKDIVDKICFVIKAVHKINYLMPYI